MALKPFEKWNYEELNLEFGYDRLFAPFAQLDEWLSASQSVEIKTEDWAVAQKLRTKLALEVDGHNEEELKMLFITPLLSIIDLGRTSVYKLFAQRKISAIIQKNDGTSDILNGRVEAMVALGIQKPRHPYFFIHEYKPHNKSTADPLGQLVAAMIVAQITNSDEKPIYGLYVMGKYWNFVVLNAKEYAESRSYDATKIEDLKLILQALFWVKQYIEHRIDTENV
ncbi:MAG: hypothetical protein RI894_2514 [Bacteroidota bacterium]|jgi:hypothetical protein